MVADLTVWMLGEGYSRKTVAVYTRRVAMFERWLEVRGLDVDLVDAAAVREYSETLPRTHATQESLRAALIALWRCRGREGAPTSAVRVPTKPQMDCRALDDAQAHRLATAARARWDLPGLAVLFGLYAGLRREEIARLRWRDIEDDRLEVLGKGDRTRRIPLHPAIAERLGPARRQSTSEWIFPGRFDGPSNPARIWEWSRQVSIEAGLDPVTTHVLRHTALATAHDRTGDLRAVQVLAGHSRPETTAGYTRARWRRLEAAVAAIDYAAAAS